MSQISRQRVDNVIGNLLRFTLFSCVSILFTACGSGGSDTSGNTTPIINAPPVNTVSGEVMMNGSPLSGATIIAFNTNTNAVVQTTTTDASGKYTITGLQTGWNSMPNYQIWATKDGYAFYPAVGNNSLVIRQDYTGQYNTAVSGIYKTVINFDSLANASLTNADFNAYDGSHPLVSLAATGQTTSYVNGDDAALHEGVAWPSSRFTDNADGTVTDHLTGLIWLQNAGCFMPTSWSAALTDINQLASGTCGLTDGSSAGQWRLPNINELESLVDVSQSNPALPSSSLFTNVSSTDIYWSSTTYFGLSSNAWTLRFSDGRYMNDSLVNDKASAMNAVWAVKGGTNGTLKLRTTGQYIVYAAGDDPSKKAGVGMTYPRFIDNGNGTITDSMTGLIWLKQSDCIQQIWSAALSTIGNLASGQCGLTDGSAAGSWRMPNRAEMLSLSDRALGNHADYFDNNFVNSAGVGSQAAVLNGFIAFQYYWTSTTDHADITKAWTLFSCDFGVYDIDKASTGYSLAVR